jgi:hypothetical protein
MERVGISCTIIGIELESALVLENEFAFYQFSFDRLRDILSHGG